MRQQLPDRWRNRTVGAVDERIGNQVRLQSISNIPLAVGTPVIWPCADDQYMTGSALENQATFVDRVGVTWSTTSGADPLRVVPGAINGRNAWRTGDGEASSSLEPCMESTAVTTGANVTAFIVSRNYSNPNTFHIFFSKAIEWGFNYHGQALRAGYNATAFEASVLTGVTTIGALVATGAAISLYINGVLVQGPTAPAGTNSDVSSVVWLGARGSDLPPFYSNCLIAEAIAYNTNLGSTDRNAVEKYLGRKYNIAVA